MKKYKEKGTERDSFIPTQTHFITSLFLLLLSTILFPDTQIYSLQARQIRQEQDRLVEEELRRLWLEGGEQKETKTLKNLEKCVQETVDNPVFYFFILKKILKSKGTLASLPFKDFAKKCDSFDKFYDAISPKERARFIHKYFILPLYGFKKNKTKVSLEKFMSPLLNGLSVQYITSKNPYELMFLVSLKTLAREVCCEKRDY